MRIRSARIRIALWNTALFAVFLAALAAAGYWFLSYTSLERVDEFLAESGGAIASAIEFERNNGAPDSVAIRAVVSSMQLPDIAVHVFDEGSGLALSSYEGLRFMRPEFDTLDAALADSLAQAARAAPQEPELSTIVTADQAVRVFTFPTNIAGQRLMIGVAQVMTVRSRLLRDVRFALWVGFPLAVLLAALGVLWLAGKSLAPVDSMSTRAREIGASNLHQRLPVANPGDELGRLATAFNELLGRLEQAFETQARFAADASHELRTPVAVISGESELALSRQERPRDELVGALKIIHGESQRLRAIVDDLFLLARADSGERMVRPTPLHLRDLLDDSALSVRTLAASEGVFVGVRGIESAPIEGDEALLRRAIDNVLVNAIKYSRHGGTVDVDLSDEGSRWRVDIRDAGTGIPLEARERVFERFFRTDDARASRRADGAGLGLAIARWIARAHKGDIELVDSSETGSTFRLVLPKSA
jgi:heavy metal sensor kinase